MAMMIGAATAVAQLVSTHRQCTVEIENGCSTYTLCNPRFNTTSGSCTIPLPPTIAPCASGSAMFSKTPHAARGAVGVFTYDLLNKCTEKSTEKLAVMYSVPYDFNLHSNWYAVGIFDKFKECNYDLYCQMYYETDKAFVRGKANGPSLTYKGNEVTIMATMSDTSQPVMKVQVSKN